MRVGLLGGTFDPPHRAHVLAAEAALATGEVDRVLVVPVFEHAFNKRPGASFEDRMEMCRRAFALDPRVQVSDIEAHLPRPNYTLATVEALEQLEPEARFRLVAGSDVLVDLPRWHRVDQLLERAPLLLLKRQGYPAPSGLWAGLPELSSSEVRGLLARRVPNATQETLDETRLIGALSRPVLDYIEQKRLYASRVD